MQHQDIPDLQNLITLRHHLHQHPELSGSESETAKRINNFIANYNPDKVYTGIGGTGLAVVFDGKAPDTGPTILFRAELDALPIAATNVGLAYTSVKEGIGHKCGHDGHMTILAGLGALLHQKKPDRGKVVLLFQPAEETGAGAWAILQDEVFKKHISPDYVFGLHNLPGWPKYQVIVKDNVFAAASTGMIVELEGKPSHAAEPENGTNPGEAMAEIIQAFNGIISQKHHFQDLTLLTVIHARLGEIAFGTNPGFATVMATLRSYQPHDLQKLKNLATSAVQQIAAMHGLKHSIEFVEEFPATINHRQEVQYVREAAQALELPLADAVQPFRWSEDFGHFTATYKGAFFGLGAGSEQPQLHHSDYDFPDDLIPTGANLFYAIIDTILNR